MTMIDRHARAERDLMHQHRFDRYIPRQQTNRHTSPRRYYVVSVSIVAFGAAQARVCRPTTSKSHKNVDQTGGRSYGEGQSLRSHGLTARE